MRPVAPLLLLASVAVAAVEWYGDERQPEGAAEFYDLTYDDNVCVDGGELVSHAVADYMYFGPLLGAFLVDASDGCIRECMLNTRCQSVNYYKPSSATFQERGFCELLAETQWDNPRWMRPYPNAVYYENIACKSEPAGAEKFSQTSDSGAESATPLFLENLYSKLAEYVKSRRRHH